MALPPSSIGAAHAANAVVAVNAVSVNSVAAPGAVTGTPNANVVFVSVSSSSFTLVMTTTFTS